MDFIDLKTQYRGLRESIDKRIQAVLDHGQYILGPEVEELEEKLADYVSVKHCVTVSSGTDALLMSLMALEIGPGDEVITSPFTFIATGEVIALLGARPVFVDIDRRTFNLNPTALEDSISSDTRAIIPVSVFGQCAEFDEINSVASRHGLTVIEDGAQSFGATYKGARSCGLTDVACASFFPSKPLGCYGDGGAVFTHDASLARLFRELRSHGEDRRYHHVRIGINGRMDTLQAAVLLAKMEVFDEELASRSHSADRYERLIHDAFGADNRVAAVATPYIEPHNTSVFAQYTVTVAEPKSVQDKMRSHSIPTAIHYPVPLHLQPAFERFGDKEGSFPVAESVSRQVISLPMHPYLTDKEQVTVVRALEDSISDLVS
ncbi:MAG: DegT/DnrJ/EryC1/StrS family aminotransferase [Candidatus Rariloculaceae bacterium]